ncbi:MAG: protein translocase subunit SecF, partial [Candidatus Omnitrophota bacterium]
QITGNFTSQEAGDLSLVLRAGALPAPVKIIEERTVGASLGKDSVENGVRAGIIGSLFVFLFMPAYYLLAGVVANIGLLLYGLITLGAFAALNATLTLPGIAGLILSVGMAVDANVLIFERIREEFEAGKPSRAAVSAGYHKAFSAILDSNLTTLLTSVLLFMFGSGPVKGFAVTLSLGIVASMFSAIFVTRMVFDFLLENNPKLGLKMLQMFRKTNIRFLNGRYWAYGFSVITLALGIGAIFLRGQQNYGVEFTGGTSVHLAFSAPVEISKLREAVAKEGIPSATIQYYGETAQNQFVIKSAKASTDLVEKAAKAAGGETGYKILRVDELGPTVSKDLTRKAIYAVIWSALGILVYLAWRFELLFALSAVVALFHDTIFTFGIYALSGREINLPVIAAILTIMGFSVNDTIVTFDRVRDNMKLMRKSSFKDIVEASINQTLSRTILTTMTVLFSTLGLFFFGGAAINDFAFVMLIGFCVGVYSTIFVATSLVVDLKKR